MHGVCMKWCKERWDLCTHTHTHICIHRIYIYRYLVLKFLLFFGHDIKLLFKGVVQAFELLGLPASPSVLEPDSNLTRLKTKVSGELHFPVWVKLNLLLEAPLQWIQLITRQSLLLVLHHVAPISTTHTATTAVLHDLHSTHQPLWHHCLWQHSLMLHLHSCM